MKRMWGGGGGNWHLIAQKGIIWVSVDVGLDYEKKVSDLLEETYTYLVIN